VNITPFTVRISDAALADLRHRLAVARWPDEVADSGWDYGMPMQVAKRIVAHWHNVFDWRQAERQLNRLPQFQIELWQNRATARATVRPGGYNAVWVFERTLSRA
jgi:Epoxide hydrolase N terminus